MTNIRKAVAPKFTAPPSPSPSARPKAPAASASKSGASVRPTVVDSSRFGQARPEAVMKRFYDAFVNRRFDEVEKLYAPNVKFKDLVFEYDNRKDTMQMWRKLIGAPGGKYRFEFDRVEGNVAHGRWIADYKLGGRPVHNELETRMVIRDGKIVEHVDKADWGKWARQALPLGKLGTTRAARALITPALRAFVAHG